MTELKHHGIDELSRFAIDIIRQSGEQAISYYGKGKSSMKFDEELVTEAELHITEFFKEQLHITFPEHQLFEGDQQEPTEYTHDEKRYLWIFDPLDGVASFQAGIPIWGLSLSLIENFWPVIGVFYMPATGDLFHARAGDKAFWNDREIHIANHETINDESLLLTYSRFHTHYRTTFPGKIRNLGCTAAHVCYVAMGRADAAILANESYHDLAAAQIIIESAGGKVYKSDGSDFYLADYLNGQKIDDHLLVASPALAAQIREHLTKIS